ncbi:MAG: hypothetical protein H7Y00_02130, partial [Fimbriimonadaceae bacterium]|nr:hypothetical protein [Chitinophagales bacterium]
MNNKKPRFSQNDLTGDPHENTGRANINIFYNFIILSELFTQELTFNKTFVKNWNKSTVQFAGYLNNTFIDICISFTIIIFKWHDNGFPPKKGDNMKNALPKIICALIMNAQFLFTYASGTDYKDFSSLEIKSYGAGYFTVSIDRQYFQNPVKNFLL